MSIALLDLHPAYPPGQLPDGVVVFAIGDIHGCLEPLQDLMQCIFAKIKKDYAGKKSKIIFLGDYINRGPDSKGVLEYLIALQHKCAAHADIEMVVLRGPRCLDGERAA